MVDYAAVVVEGMPPAVVWEGRQSAIYAGVLTPYDETSIRVDDPPALDTSPLGAEGFSDDGQKSSFAEQDFDALVSHETTPGTDWFEKFHVIPREFDFGQVVSDQEEDVEVYSAYRDDEHDWTGFVNNAGAGVTLVVQPSYPETFVPQSGFDLTLEVSTSGTPSVDTTLDFAFDGETVYVPIVIERVVLFTVDPEAKFQELMVFATDVQRHKDASEKRLSVRKNPRQIFEWDLMLDDGLERTRIHNILFDWQSRVFGIPVWSERTVATTLITAGDTTITVRSTDYADYRVGGLAVIFQSHTVFDVLPVDSVTSTTITFTSPALNSYSAGVAVLPLRVAVAERLVRGTRYHKNLSRLRMRFRVTDNDVDLADTSAFSAFNSKVLLDDHNVISGMMTENFERQLTQLDNVAGVTFQDSTWTRHRRGSFKTFWAGSKQRVWEVRQLMHALRGKQISFYLPTFSDDLTPVAGLTNGSANLNVSHCGYTQYVQQRTPLNVIRVSFNDGSTAVLRTVQSSSVVSATEELLTVDSNWTQDYALGTIDRIEYVEKVRFDNDTITIIHQPSTHSAKINAPVKVVLE